MGPTAARQAAMDMRAERQALIDQAKANRKKAAADRKAAKAARAAAREARQS